MSTDLDDGIGVLVYFAGFWLFVFSRGFREVWIAEFKAESMLAKFYSSMEAVLSVALGVVAPGYLVWWLIF